MAARLSHGRGAAQRKACGGRPQPCWMRPGPGEDVDQFDAEDQGRAAGNLAAARALGAIAEVGGDVEDPFVAGRMSCRASCQPFTRPFSGMAAGWPRS